jgi:hypothetical protein
MSFEGNCSNACGTNKSITQQIINLEINNIIQDQMVRIGKAMVRIIRITHITSVVIIKIIGFDKME